jgi:hypothetical protein
LHQRNDGSAWILPLSLAVYRFSRDVLSRKAPVKRKLSTSDGSHKSFPPTGESCDGAAFFSILPRPLVSSTNRSFMASHKPLICYANRAWPQIEKEAACRDLAVQFTALVRSASKGRVADLRH